MINYLLKIPIIASKIAKRDMQLQSTPLAAMRNCGMLSDSLDNSPWDHPFLCKNALQRFRLYSDAVGSFAAAYVNNNPINLSCAFSVNMAQNMYKWGCLAQKYGVEARLYLHPHDQTALSAPEWEEYDGEYQDLLDGSGFHALNPDISTSMPVYRPLMDGGQLWSAVESFSRGDRKTLLKLLSDHPGLRHEPLLCYEGAYPYFNWAQQFNAVDVIYSASLPIAAYFSGQPFCYCPVGGDLQWDCGRGDSYGELMALSVNAARFMMVSNPHMLAHSRRLGFTNGVYLPYPMDSAERYCPGKGRHRADWEEKYGKGVYILTTSRLDKDVKGFGDEFLKAIIDTARNRPQVRFIFLAWGNHADEFKRKIAETGLENQLIVLLPVGKKRLIDYYRSCDIVLDQLVYGYYGATALEAAAIGKPVIMKLRKEQYAPLYDGDVAPVCNVDNPTELEQTLLGLIDNPELCRQRGKEMRDWLVRNHGEEKTVPRLLALLRLTADQVPLPSEIAGMNPLLDEESEEEKVYHQSCLRERVC